MSSSSVISFMDHVFGVVSEKTSQYPRRSRSSSTLSSRIFIVLQSFRDNPRLKNTCGGVTPGHLLQNEGQISASCLSPHERGGTDSVGSQAGTGVGSPNVIHCGGPGVPSSARGHVGSPTRPADAGVKSLSLISQTSQPGLWALAAGGGQPHEGRRCGLERKVTMRKSPRREPLCGEKEMVGD